MADRITKVLMVAPAAPLVGGQAVQAKRLFDKLQSESEIHVDLQPINPSFFPSLQSIKYLRTVLTEMKYVFDLIRKIPNYDVIHIFSAGDSGFVISTVPAVYLARLFRKKTILNYRHGGAAEHIRAWKRTALPTIKKFDKIITPSDFLVDVFADFGLESSSISNFVDDEKYKFRERKQLRPVFLSNRNFESLYNVSCTIRAFGLIQKRYPDAKLLIAGDGGERNKLRQLAKELNLKNVEFLGQISSDEMVEMYDQADIYLNSPNIDNMPNSIIEAFACGLAVVSTNAGGIPFIVNSGQTGMLVDVDDHRSLASEAIKLLEDRDLATKIIAQAADEVRQYFWPNVREKWLALYAELGNTQLTF